MRKECQLAPFALTPPLLLCAALGLAQPRRQVVPFPTRAGIALPAPRTTSTQISDVNTRLDSLARDTAQLLRDDTNRTDFFNKYRASRVREQRLGLKAFATESRDRVAGTRVLAGRLISSTTTATRTIQQVNLGRAADFDMYFPVRQHRTQWTGDSNLVVAFAPTGDEDSVTQIQGYRVQDGQRATLRADTPPSEPTLVIALPEGPTQAVPRSLMIPPLPSGAEPPDEAVAPPPDPYIGIRYLKLLDDQEPWWKGDPEIYVLVGQSHTTQPIKHKIYLDYVNDEDHWYSLGESPGGALYFYFDNSYSDLIYFHFMEEDTGDLFTVNASVEYAGVSVGLSFKVRDGDDDLGYRYESKNAVPFTGYVDRSTGRAAYKLDKDP